MARKERIKIQLDSDILEWVKAEAERRRISVSHLIRELALEAMRKGRKR